MDKLKNLMLYLAEKCCADQHFGATKLNKLLFLIDFNAYALHGKPMTEAVYVHRAQGPVPQQLLQARDALIEEGRAELVKEAKFPGGYPIHRLKAKRGADMSTFTDLELSLIDVLVDHLLKHDGSTLSEATHTMLPWLWTRDGEVIPYETVFALHGEPVTLDDREWALAELDRLGIR